MKIINAIALIITLLLSTAATSQSAKVPKNDQDSDTVLDKDDLCPALSGTVELKGCPAAKPTLTDSDALTLIARAKAFQTAGDFKQAAETFHTVAQSDSKYFGEAAYLLGMQFLQRNRLPLAEKAFERSAEGGYAPPEK